MNERGSTMKIARISYVILVWWLVLTMAAPAGLVAQETAAPPQFKPEQLEQIVAPIALYPDDLLAQIFMASTYPLEIVQAARWVKGESESQGRPVDQSAGGAELGPER